MNITRRTLVFLRRTLGINLPKETWETIGTFLEKAFTIVRDEGMKTEKRRIIDALKKTGRLPEDLF